MAREAYFASDLPMAQGLPTYRAGYIAGYRKAMNHVAWLVKRKTNNLERLQAIDKLIKEV